MALNADVPFPPFGLFYLQMGTHVVTGAFGFTGRCIAQRLIDAEVQVKTLTGHPDRSHPFGDRIAVAPLDFNRPAELAGSLEGAQTLFNTYWIRFPYGDLDYDQAVENSKVLIAAAAKAGVGRIVHLSITSASPDSPLAYFRGKGRVEEAILESGLAYAILRPTVIFGREGILINNIAWMLRTFPIFAVPGSGAYRLQPVFVEDLAELAVSWADRGDNAVVDAVGPETFTFNELVRAVARAIGARARLVHLPAGLSLLCARAIGLLVGDVVLTREEIEGLSSGLLVSDRPPLGPTRLSDWLRENADRVGRRYASELARHYR